MDINPWLKLDLNTSFVHPDDEQQIAKFNLVAKPDVRYELSLRPEPYIGNLEAPILLLALNPGVSEDDFSVHKNKFYIEQHESNLKQRLTSVPFYYLNKSLECPGSSWWRAKLKWLINECGEEHVSKSICCLQYIPYHSKTYKHSSKQISTQRFAREVVQRHIQRNLPIVLMRSRKYWEGLVPELSSYNNITTLKNPRNPTLSPLNVANDMYPLLVQHIKRA